MPMRINLHPPLFSYPPAPDCVLIFFLVNRKFLDLLIQHLGRDVPHLQAPQSFHVIADEGRQGIDKFGDGAGIGTPPCYLLRLGAAEKPEQIEGRRGERAIRHRVAMFAAQRRPH